MKMRLMQVAIVLATVFASIHWKWSEGPGSGLASFFIGGWLAYAATCIVIEIQIRRGLLPPSARLRTDPRGGQRVDE